MTFGNKIKSFFGIKVELNDDFFEELTDLLVEGDFGAALAMETVERLEERCKKAKINTASDAKELLALMIKEYIDMAPNGIEAEFDAEAFNVILLLGVNGVGKTTSAAKLAYLYKNAAACKPLLAAGDTFRAAAIDQLLLHGERLDVRVVAHKQHGGAAAVIFDALEAAAAGAYKPVIAYTAGRMHTKTPLVE
jgi:fused signal recognition particle receptor